MKKLPRYSDIEIEDVIWSDYPDFSDAYLHCAWDRDKKRWCNDEELNDLSEDGFVSEYIHDNLTDFSPYN